MQEVEEGKARLCAALVSFWYGNGHTTGLSAGRPEFPFLFCILLLILPVILAGEVKPSELQFSPRKNGISDSGNDGTRRDFRGHLVYFPNFTNRKLNSNKSSSSSNDDDDDDDDNNNIFNDLVDASHYSKLFTSTILFSQQPHWVGSIVIPILQIGKLKCSEVQYPK